MKYLTSDSALELLNQLISIPSFVGNKNPGAEKSLEDFLINWFSVNLPNYKLTTISYDKGRRNLLFLPKDTCRWLFACHMDTVLPQRTTDMKLTKKSDRIYGLGSKDMKGGIVSTLLALQEADYININSQAGVLFYGDEEYSQQGIQAVTKNSSKLPQIDLIISPESRFALGYGARGMCVVKLIIKGKRAHSSRPHLGVDAIKLFYQAMTDLEKRLSKKTALGKTSVTISELRGGLLIDGKVDVHYGSIPDFSEGTLSMRVAQVGLTNQLVSDIIKDSVIKAGGEVQSLKIITNYPARISKLSQIKTIVNAIQSVNKKIDYSDPGLTGYNDMAILSEKLKVPLVNFGPYGENNHNPDEWVSLKSTIDTSKVFLKLMGDNIHGNS